MTIGLTALVDATSLSVAWVSNCVRPPTACVAWPYVRRHRAPLTLEVMARWARLDNHASVDPGPGRGSNSCAPSRWMQIPRAGHRSTT